MRDDEVNMKDKVRCNFGVKQSFFRLLANFQVWKDVGVEIKLVFVCLFPQFSRFIKQNQVYAQLYKFDVNDFLSLCVKRFLL